MNINPYKFSKRKLLVLSALLFLLVFGSTAQSSNTAWAQFPLPDIGGGPKSDAAKLAKFGPALPAIFNRNSFTISGFLQDRWPVVIVYELDAESTAEVAIRINQSDKPFLITLQPTNNQRKEEIHHLPEGFGKKPQVGLLSFRTFKTGPDDGKPSHFFLYGLGVGPKAVGSVAIYDLHFNPDSINTKLKEKASYSFRASSDFNKAAAEFMLVARASDGVFRPQLVNREMLKNGVRKGDRVTKNWDGKNTQGKISPGPHQFQVRVWRNLDSGGDWVYAAINQNVMVQ